MTSNAATDVHYDGVDASSSSCSKAHFTLGDEAKAEGNLART